MMTHTGSQLAVLLVVLTNFGVLGTSRLSACIRAVGAQGLLLGVLPLLLAPHVGLHAIGLAAGTVAVKTVALPWFLSWAIREASVRREVEPIVGYTASLLLGTAALALAFGIAARLPLPPHAGGSEPLLVPVSLATLFTGFAVLVTRRKALTQVVGYLMLENGIFALALVATYGLPAIVEIGVFLDVLAIVLIMEAVVLRIRREHDSIEVDRLRELRG